MSSLLFHWLHSPPEVDILGSYLLISIYSDCFERWLGLLGMKHMVCVFSCYIGSGGFMIFLTDVRFPTSLTGDGTDAM
jgi:hypothetical protein